MMKKILVAVLLVALVAALAGPAAAAKKKKKLKPWKSDEVSITTGHPGMYTGDAGVSLAALEMMANCGVPQSNGVDAYVWELPEAYRTIAGGIEAHAQAGSTAANGYDLDLYLFDESCQRIGTFNSDVEDEVGALLPGTRYVLMDSYRPGEITGAHIVVTPL